VIRGAGEHALQLGLAQARVDGGRLRGDVGDDALVALGSAQLEVVARVGEIALEPRGELDLRLRVRALSQRLLRGFVVVPEPWGEGPVGQIFQQAGEPRDVKDAPLAHHGAA
jgi:hypothetical protein